ncbi:tetratricopeptide repeat protein [Flavobacterium sp. F-65]|uniref:Tetratricopeptide repeat protein n=1 Tax=Flavobacterium pisciphilum TaxID=2893755 RepID=A0ABS8MTS5_9FLAO|nr:tetratricopeptide repeat protein [Flavobacterium sp. F-65]MCC9072179.1 tetratricopeptide repeat protein [Flavobacterium sp. F-65]
MNEERHILFDQYLQGEMTAEERNGFEKQLSEDPEFASSFETFKNVNLHLETKFGYEQERAAFKKNLRHISDAHFDKKHKKNKAVSLKPWYYAVAASVAVLIGLFFFNYDINPVFEDFNHPEQASFTERGDTNVTLKEAEVAFNARKYKEAIPLFEEILKETKTPEIQYFYGVSLLEDNQLKKAEMVFNELKSGAPVYKDKALWNLALLKLKQKDYTACKGILETISQDYEGYDDVQELLNELD